MPWVATENVAVRAVRVDHSRGSAARPVNKSLLHHYKLYIVIVDQGSFVCHHIMSPDLRRLSNCGKVFPFIPHSMKTTDGQSESSLIISLHCHILLGNPGS